jgi:hypothetical protein
LEKRFEQPSGRIFPEGQNLTARSLANSIRGLAWGQAGNTYNTCYTFSSNFADIVEQFVSEGGYAVTFIVKIEDYRTKHRDTSQSIQAGLAPTWGFLERVLLISTVGSKTIDNLIIIKLSIQAVPTGFDTTIREQILFS